MSLNKITFTKGLLIVLVLGVVIGIAGYIGKDASVTRSRFDIQNGQPFSTPTDPDQLVGDARGGVYPVNRVGVNLLDDATRSDAEELVASVNGTIVGYLPTANIYVFEVPTATIDELAPVRWSGCVAQPSFMWPACAGPIHSPSFLAAISCILSIEIVPR